MWVPLLANFLAFESVGATFQTSIDRILGVAVGTAVAYGTVVFQNVFNVPREVSGELCTVLCFCFVFFLFFLLASLLKNVS